MEPVEMGRKTGVIEVGFESDAQIPSWKGACSREIVRGWPFVLQKEKVSLKATI